MKFVVQYEAPEALDLDAVRQHFPAHRAMWQEYVAAGTLLLIGPMVDPRDGAMAVFTTREAAESFIAADPFVTERLMASYRILEWNEVLLPPV